MSNKFESVGFCLSGYGNIDIFKWSIAEKSQKQSCKIDDVLSPPQYSQYVFTHFIYDK